MTRSTRVVVIEAPSDPHVREVPLAELGDRDVLIRTTYSGISTGTDRWIVTGRFIPGMTFPLTVGYQRSGVVEAIGPGVTRFRVGQTVASTSATGVGPYSHGSHVALASSPEDAVYDATGVDPLAASLLVVAQVGFNAANRIQAPSGARVAVFGDGVIGACGALAAVARGFDVLLVGRHDDRLASVGAHSVETLNARTDGVDGVREWAPVAVIDTVQNDASFAAYVDVVPARTGQVVFSGWSPDDVRHWADMLRMQERELTVHFVSGATDERLLETLRLMRIGRFPVETLVGDIARGDADIERLMREVATATVAATAAVIAW